MAEGELPQEVAEATQKEFGQKSEADKSNWNQKFNSAADKLDEEIKRQRNMLNPLLGKAPTSAKEIPGHITRQAGAATVMVSMTELSTLRLLAELAAKATGGRKSLSPAQTPVTPKP
ncbi:hypothetical protein HY382_01780 [Candidatus Curtissbacteria bacterium]|nr:hypothetical protein [Candidatus Curtissbacteria bacterium]